jgi:hypothetical protein
MLRFLIAVGFAFLSFVEVAAENFSSDELSTARWNAFFDKVWKLPDVEKFGAVNTGANP